MITSSVTFGRGNTFAPRYVDGRDEPLLSSLIFEERKKDKETQDTMKILFFKIEKERKKSNTTKVLSFSSEDTDINRITYNSHSKSDFQGLRHWVNHHRVNGWIHVSTILDVSSLVSAPWHDDFETRFWSRNKHCRNEDVQRTAFEMSHLSFTQSQGGWQSGFAWDWNVMRQNEFIFEFISLLIRVNDTIFISRTCFSCKRWRWLRFWSCTSMRTARGMASSLVGPCLSPWSDVSSLSSRFPLSVLLYPSVSTIESHKKAARSCRGTILWPSTFFFSLLATINLSKWLIKPILVALLLLARLFTFWSCWSLTPRWKRVRVQINALFSSSSQSKVNEWTTNSLPFNGFFGGTRFNGVDDIEGFSQLDCSKESMGSSLVSCSWQWLKLSDDSKYDGGL